MGVVFSVPKAMVPWHVTVMDGEGTASLQMRSDQAKPSCWRVSTPRAMYLPTLCTARNIAVRFRLAGPAGFG